MSDTFFEHMGFILLHVKISFHNKRLCVSAIQNNVTSAFYEADRTVNVFLDLADDLPGSEIVHLVNLRLYALTLCTLPLDWLATGRTRKHLGLCCIRPFVRRLCLFSSVIYRGTHIAPSVRPSRGRAPIRSGRTEPSISEEGKLRARNGRLNFALSIRLPRNRKGFLTCRKSTTRIYFPSEGRHA
jgi:hypothetical protein